MAAHQAPLSLGFSRQEYSPIFLPGEEYSPGKNIPSPTHACMLSYFSCVQLCANLRTAVHQVPLFMGFSRQEYWGGLPFFFSIWATREVVVKSVRVVIVQINKYWYLHIDFLHSSIMHQVIFKILCCILRICCILIIFMYAITCFMNCSSPLLGP